MRQQGGAGWAWKWAKHATFAPVDKFERLLKQALAPFVGVKTHTTLSADRGSHPPPGVCLLKAANFQPE
jgi:hypothetical protein